MAKSGGKNKKTGKRASRESNADHTPVKTGEKAVVAETSRPVIAPVQQKAVHVEAVAPAKKANPAIRLIRSYVSIYSVAIMAVIAVMLYIRISLPYSAVFTSWPGNFINIASDDAPEQMRMVFNTLAHFPIRELYDPFTHYPYGSLVHFGPLFTLMIAASSLVVGLGHPSAQLVVTVGAYIPAILGALCAIPTYYAGKKLFGRNAGLLAAVILMFLPGQFLARSLLGFTDHHVAEVLFSVASIAFLVYALDAAKKAGLSLERIRSRDLNAIKGPLLFAGMAGLVFGCYLLSWPGALLVSFMLFIYFTIQCVFDHVRGRPLDSTLIIAAFMYLIPAVMVLPYSMAYPHFNLVAYSLTQPVILVLAFLGIAIIYAVSRLMELRKLPKQAYPVALIFTAMAGILLIFIAFPQIYAIIIAGLTKFNANSGMLTVAEAFPTYIDRTTGEYSLGTFWSDFNWNFYISILALVLLAYKVYKDDRPALLMFLVWNVTMLWATFMESRFTYYFAVNAALLTAFFTMELYRMCGSDQLKENFAKKVKAINDIPKFIGKNAWPSTAMVLITAMFIMIAIWPVTGLGQNITQSIAEGGPGGMQYEWYDALLWLGNHTPDPQGSPVQANFDYANGTYAIPSEVGADNYSDYPASAYSVMSWWDYGNAIEYVSHRIPDANPFQDGIAEKNLTIGASPFFCSTNESRSYNILNALNSRYVVIDDEMATDGWQGGKFGAIQTWINDTDGWAAQNQSGYIWLDSQAGTVHSGGTVKVPVIQDTDKFNESMMNRLYFQDCDGMSHYRLVYESEGSYYVDVRACQVTQDDSGQSYVQYIGGGGTIPMNPIANYSQAEEVYQMYGNYVIGNSQSLTQYMYGARPPEKWVKIFEKVEGASITGSAPDGSTVTANVTLKTDWGREFNYTISGVAKNGAYTLVVPYPTEAMKGSGYSYGIVAEGPYTVSYGNTTKSVDVSENAVMSGLPVNVT